MVILDCTLRDGGYYNKWDFDSNIVENYLRSIASSGIEYVELGLRNFPKQGFLGAFAYTTEHHLNRLDLPVGPRYGVMVDAKTILSSDLSVSDAVKKLFVPASCSKLSFVRVAAHFDEVENCRDIVVDLKKLGYLVGFNLMQSGGKPSELVEEKANLISKWNSVDVLYFADSLGNMDSLEVERLVLSLRSGWSGPLGIHTHNNMGKGLENSLKATQLGVEWIDATVTGMGRGAGNTQTEFLLATLSLDTQYSHYNPKPLYELVIRYFEPLQRQFGWGSNLLYFLGAQNNIHPTYIQTLLSNSHYGTDELVGAIDYLSKIDGSSSYNNLLLDSALDFSTSEVNDVGGSSKLNGIFEGKEVLVIANGPSLARYSSALNLYIEIKKPLVLSVNICTEVTSDLVDFYVFSHNVKFLSDLDKYSNLKNKVILPKNRFSNEEISRFDRSQVLDFGLSVKKDIFEVDNLFVTVPYDLTVAYVLGILVAGNAKNVKLAGFDGFEKGDRRQREMLNLLSLCKDFSSQLILESLTPTSYPVVQGSVYAIS